MNNFRNVLLVAACVLATWATPTSSTAQSPSPPDDSTAYHLIVVTSNPPTPACSRLLAALDHPNVAQIAKACKTFKFGPSDPIYLARYADSLSPDQTPIVALVRHDGGVIFKASGQNIPGPEALAQSLTSMAVLDRAQNPRPVNSVDDSIRPLRTPDGNWRTPDLRPNLIPDTVVVRPEINMPAGFNILLIVGGVLIFFLLFGIAAFAVLAGAFLLIR